MKFFIASGRTNRKAIKDLDDNLASLNHQASLFTPQEGTQLKKVFEADLTKLEEADRVILLLPAGKNSHLAAGIAYGFGKHLTLIGTPENAEANYFIFDDTYATIEEFIAALRPQS